MSLKIYYFHFGLNGFLYQEVYHLKHFYKLNFKTSKTNRLRIRYWWNINWDNLYIHPETFVNIYAYELEFKALYAQLKDLSNIFHQEFHWLETETHSSAVSNSMCICHVHNLVTLYVLSNRPLFNLQNCY